MKKVILIILLFMQVSCNVKQHEIYFGEDACHYCSMTIVDKQHAAELVTDKGKVFKFDAIECMVHHLAENEVSPGLLLVSNYSEPGTLIDANKASFIISPNIPSPMKANLSAVLTIEEARQLQLAKEGDIYTWKELQLHLKN